MTGMECRRVLSLNGGMEDAASVLDGVSCALGCMAEATGSERVREADLLLLLSACVEASRAIIAKEAGL